MKLCTFEVATPVGRMRRLGALEPGGVVDLNFAAEALLGHPRLAGALVPASLLELLDGGALSMAAAELALAELAPGRDEDSEGRRLRYRAEEIRLLAPLPDARSLRDFYAFEGHVRRGFERRGEPMPEEWYEFPAYYQSGHHNLIGPGQDVLWPSFTERFDYELELAAVIGRRGTNIPAEEADEYIAGYTILNDFSARDIQKKEMKIRLGPAKGKHWCSALGPCMVTRSELADPYNLAMIARVNGEQWSRGSSSGIHWSFAEMIEFLTRDDTIYPGDILGSGTVSGGCGLELDRWVRPGDSIELEIEGIGVLRNRVVRNP